MKSVLISIRPRWCDLIAAGKKTLEIRKTRPNMQPPFKCYIYCTKNPKIKLWRSKTYVYADDRSHNLFDKDCNGKVIGYFECTKIQTVYQCHSGFVREYGRIPREDYFRYLGLPFDTHFGYEKHAFAWFISCVEIFDAPKMPGEFTRLRKTKFGYEPVRLERPPQSWCYVEEL